MEGSRLKITTHIPEPVETTFDIKGLPLEDAKLLLALLGKTYAGLNMLFDQLNAALRESGFDYLNDEDDEMCTRLLALIGREGITP